MTIILIVMVVLCVLLGGFFAGAETAMVAVPKPLLHARAAKGDRNAALARQITDDPARFLVTILVGINLCHVTATSLATLATNFLPSAWHSIVVTAVMTPVFLLFAELLPKSIGLGSALGVSLAAAPWLWRLQWILAPVGNAVSYITENALRLAGARAHSQVLSVSRDEVLALADISVEQGVIAKPEHTMIRRVFALNRTPLSTVMVPLAEMDCVAATASLAEVILLAHAIRHPYLAVFDGRADNVIGLVYIADVLDIVAQARLGGSRVTLNDLVDRDVPRIPQATPVGTMLNALQQKAAPHVFATNEQGGVTGMTTVQDIAETIIGDWARERPRDRPVLKDIRGGVECEGRVDVDIVADSFGVSFDKDGYDTVGGLVVKCAGRVPKTGQTVVCQNLVFTVLRATPKRVVSVSIARKT